MLMPHARIPRIQGMAETSLQADADLSSMTHRKAWSRPPIEVDFQVLMFTASGLLVRFLKVFEKSNYQSVKVSVPALRCRQGTDRQWLQWVRYLSRANGSYLIRF